MRKVRKEKGEIVPPKVLFEDASVIVIDKPSGWIVNKASTTTTQPVIQDWLEKLEFNLSGNDEYRSGIVHRIDKETSGILIIAKDVSSLEIIQKQFKDRLVKKEYTALTHGVFNMKEGSVEAPLGRLPWRRDRFGVLPSGRDAKTFYTVIGEYSNGSEKYSLVSAFPKTGRTHQIRIHLKHINHSIVSDHFYAGRKTARGDRKWCHRLFLHASKISFKHPKSAKNVSFESDLPSDLKMVLSTLTLNS